MFIFWKFWLYIYIPIYIVIYLLNNGYLVYKYKCLKEDNCINIFEYLCDFILILSKDTFVFNKNNKVNKNLLFILASTVISLITAPIINSTLLFYNILKWFYEKKNYKKNEGYFFLFTLITLNFFFNISSRILYIFKFYLVIFNANPFYSFVTLDFNVRNNNIAKAWDKCIYFNKINALPNLGNSSSFTTILRKSFNEMWTSNKSFAHLNLRHINPQGLNAFEEKIITGSGKEIVHFGVEGPNTHPLIMKSSPENLSKHSSNIFTVLDLKRLHNGSEVVQGCQQAYLPEAHRDLSIQASVTFLKFSAQINSYVIAEKLLNGTLVMQEGILFEVGSDSNYTEVDAPTMVFFNKMYPTILNSLNAIETGTKYPHFWTPSHKSLRDELIAKPNIRSRMGESSGNQSNRDDDFDS